MAANIGSKRKLLGSALFGLALACLVLAYFFLAAPEENQRSAGALPAEQPQAASPPRRNGSEAVAETDLPFPDPAPEDEVEDNNSARPDSRLQEAELEHLSEVFQNSVSPSFQNDFQLNREGRAAIDVFVASMPEGLGSEDLDTISAMIQRELPTAEAEDLAFVITHLYRLEQEEARLMSENAPITTMADQLEAQEQLSELRDEWFGPELAAQLFSNTDEGQPGSNDSPDPTTVESPPDGDGTGEPPGELSEEQAELAEIEDQWEQRYEQFQAEKQYIDNAGLDQAEKDRQIEALLQQHYSPEELEAARAYDQQRE